MKKFYAFLVLVLIGFMGNAQIVNIPNAAFKARLLGASPSYQIASTQTPNNDGNVSSYNTIDTNGDGEIQVSEASLIKYLYVSDQNITNLEGINGFANLLTLHCAGNQLTSLDVSGLTNLIYLYCVNNQLTSLNISGLSNLNYLACSYNQLTSLNVSGLTNLVTLYCGHNQLTSLNVSGLTNLTQLNCTNNQLTSLNVSGLTNLISLTCSYNQLTSINVSGLTNLTQLYCYNNQLTSLNVSGLTNLTQLYCNNNQLTSLFIKNNNSTWYTLDFSNNPNLQYVCADESDLALVQNKINSYGYSATCHVNSYCSFTPGGTFYTIQGSNKFDGNANGCGAEDGVYPNLKYSITDGTVSGSLISNASGNYSIPVLAGTHTITPQFENPTYFTATPTSTTVTFPATTSPFIQDFCIAPNGVHHDLEVVFIPLAPARPGFDATYKIKYKNKGNVSETATLVFNFNDAVLDFVTSTLAPTTVNTGSLSWNIGMVTPLQSGEFVVTLNVNSPMETPAVNGGDTLDYVVRINGLNTDETLFDNEAGMKQTVVNSFDPNDKKCLEGTTISPSMIGQYVHYQIRFENTGTFPAQNIVVKDMIDTTKFDISTLQISDTSHSCVTKISNTNQVEFIFENINLPFNDATNDGYVAFKIKTKPTLVLGNTFSNTANIYFDYNFPIVTNTYTTTVAALGNQDFEFNSVFSLSPVPTKDRLTISTKQDVVMSSISIYNTLGQLVQVSTNPSETIDVSGLKTGSYFIKIVSDKGSATGKFIKE